MNAPSDVPGYAQTARRAFWVDFDAQAQVKRPGAKFGKMGNLRKVSDFWRGGARRRRVQNLPAAQQAGPPLRPEPAHPAAAAAAPGSRRFDFPGMDAGGARW